MTNLNQVYKCDICGNTIEVVGTGGGEMICCGQPMQLLEPKNADPELGEKHVPVIEEEGDQFKIKIGSIPHPMEEKHYIQWIEMIEADTGDRVCRKFLKPGDKPELIIKKTDCPGLVGNIDKFLIRECCSLHLLWANK
jgi:superoxide reductase